MPRAGYVLAGGRSSRMGIDKAFLPFGDSTLVEHVARQVDAAADSVTLVGPAATYLQLGLRVVEDRHGGQGPLSGIHAALLDTRAEWNLVVACDLPNLKPHFLTNLFQEAKDLGVDALMPAGPSGKPEPLCAIYRRSCLAAVEAALADGRRKVTDALGTVHLHILPVAAGHWFENANTPGDWQRILQERGLDKGQ